MNKGRPGRRTMISNTSGSCRGGRSGGDAPPRIDKSRVLTIIMVKMTPKRHFEIIYAPITKDHLRAIERKYYSLIRRTTEAQLRSEPDAETRNRKPLKRSVAFEAEWEIRFGPDNRFRVFYEINHERNEVYILAIGVKKGNRLFIGGEEVES